MKRIIEISDGAYSRLKNRKETTLDLNNICKAILIGKPLPKGHGRLIDENKITEVYMDKMEGHVVNGIRTPDRFTIIGTDAPTIIEADKEVEE